jgi:hypothetical protein
MEFLVREHYENGTWSNAELTERGSSILWNGTYNLRHQTPLSSSIDYYILQKTELGTSGELLGKSRWKTQFWCI